MEKKVFQFELKELNDDGTFEGYAAIFRKGADTDLGKDRIDKGAFKKTLEEGKYFPLHWYHNIADPVGEMTGTEDKTGLKVEGKLILEVQRAKELYALMRKTKSVAKQLSIGYEAVKWTMEGEIRVLKEIKLYEVSIVTFGMDQGAFITDVKAVKPSIEEALGEIVLWQEANLTDEQKELATKAAESLNALLAQKEPPSGTPKDGEPQDSAGTPEYIHALASFNDGLTKLNRTLTEVKSDT